MTEIQGTPGPLRSRSSSRSTHTVVAMNQSRSSSAEKGNNRGGVREETKSESRQEKVQQIGEPNSEESQDESSELEKNDPNQVDFDSPEDPYRPLNHSKVKKWVAVMAVASAAACVTCTSSMASSTYKGIEESFGVSQTVAVLSVSLFVAGLGCGPLVLGPLSEFYGRRHIYLGSYGTFLLFNIPVAFANNIAVHLIFRFLTGFCGAAFLSVAGGTVTDLFENEHVGVPMALYSASPFLGPIAGPLIGDFINQYTDWRWTYYVIIIWSAFELAGLYLFVPESYLPQVLRIKARRLRKQTGNQDLYAPIEKSDKSVLDSILFSCKTPFLIILTQPMAVLLNLWTSLMLGILYLFFNAFTFVFEGNHGFTQSQVGMSFLGIGLGEVIASALAPYWARIYKRQAIANGGKNPPEARLIPGMAAAVLTPIGLFWFAFTSYNSVHWIVPIIGCIPFGMGIIWTFSSVFTYLVDAYRPVAASAMAANSFMRSSFAAGFPLFAGAMYHSRLGIVGSNALLAGLTLLMTPLPFVFYKIGHRFRQGSRFSAY